MSESGGRLNILKIIKQNLSESCSGPLGAGRGSPMTEPAEPVFLRLRELSALPVTPVQMIEPVDKLFPRQ